MRTGGLEAVFLVTFPQARHLLSSQGSTRDKRPLGLCHVCLFRAFLTPALSTQRIQKCKQDRDVASIHEYLGSRKGRSTPQSAPLADPYLPPRQKPLERLCTCWGQPVPYCRQCKVGLAEAAAADTGKPPCTYR